MNNDTDSSPVCRNYGKAVSDFIAACANRGALSPIEQWQWLHRCVARLYAVAVEFSLVEGMNLDWPSCMRRWPEMDDAVRAYRLDVEAAIQSQSGIDPRRRIEGEVRMIDPMPLYSESIPVLLNEMRCYLMDIHAVLLVGYKWWLLGQADQEARACECWRHSFETHWGVHALSFLKAAHILSSLSGSSWR